jgi:CubicO group peptidase (beta-lactamase class C family)
MDHQALERIDTEDGVSGWADARLRAVAEVLGAFARAEPSFTAQVAAYSHGEKVLDLWTGPSLDEGSLVCVFSVSKGLGAICLGILIERGLIDPGAPVAELWPEFAAAGKARITVETVLSHRAGLIDVDGGLTWPELLDDERAAQRLAAQRPLWKPDTAWGYHSLTMGVLMNELCRRATGGRSIQDFYEHEVRAPRGIDFYLGLPEELEHRVAPVRVPTYPLSVPTAPQLIDMMSGVILEPGLEAVANSRTSHAAGLPAASGMASARGIAHLYAAVGSDLGDGRLLSDDTIAELGQVRSHGFDIVSGAPGRFGLVFQKPFHERPFASYRAIGHDGAAGALGFFDPHDGLAFGYTTDTPAPLGGDRRADALADAIRRALAV